MLEITVKALDGWDERRNCFVSIGKDTTIRLEHSLISISKWESKYKKSFLSNEDKLSNEEFLDYIKCMTIGTVPDEVYDAMRESDFKVIASYMNDPMTATTVRTDPKRPGGRKQIITSELIYYWMTACNIPFECEKWHINRLMMLITVCSEKNKPAKKRKMSRKARSQWIAERNALNAQRRADNNTTG